MEVLAELFRTGRTLLVTSPGLSDLLQSLLLAPCQVLQPLPVPRPAVGAQCLLLRLWRQRSRVSWRCTEDVTLCGALSPRLLLKSRELARCAETQLIREVFPGVGDLTV